MYTDVLVLGGAGLVGLQVCFTTALGRPPPPWTRTVGLPHGSAPTPPADARQDLLDIAARLGAFVEPFLPTMIQVMAYTESETGRLRLARAAPAPGHRARPRGPVRGAPSGRPNPAR